MSCHEKKSMNNNTFRQCSPVSEPASEPWGPLHGLDPRQEYGVLAHELQEAFPDAAPQHLDRMIAREMALYGGHSVEVITQAMLAASLHLAGGSIDDAQGYVKRTVDAALQQEADNTALGWGA
jgi:hypothetical protein